MLKAVEKSGDLGAVLADIGRRARAAARVLALASAEQKNAALAAMADEIRSYTGAILASNTEDVAEAKASNANTAFVDRLTLTDARVADMAQAVADIAALPDPVGTILHHWTRPNGMTIERVRVPLGVIGIIYESRPNVTADAGALCLKSGNAAILRGGSESFHSSRALVAAQIGRAHV